MKHTRMTVGYGLLAAVLACGTYFATPAQAAPPTDAQIDALMDTMDMRRTLDEMFVQIDAMGESMGRQMLGDDATPEQLESLQNIMTQQRTSTRKLMSWETLGPIYRRVYARLFTAEEVEAMTVFYGSQTGRGILRKMPQAMQLSMQEMQPLMQSMFAEMQKSIESELQRDTTGAEKADHAR
jgi:uncharacterized protein